MRKLLVVLLVALSCFGFAQMTGKAKMSGKAVASGGKVSGGGSPTYNNWCVASAAADTTSCVTNGNITNNDLLVVHTKNLSFGAGTATFSLSAGTGTCGAFSSAINPTTRQDDYATAVGYCVVSGTGSATVQVSWTNGQGTFVDIAVGEYAPASAWAGLDQTTNSQNGSASVNCATGTTSATTNTNDLVIVFCDTYNQVQTWGALALFTSRANSERNTVGWYDQYVTSTGTQGATIPLSASDTSTGVVVAFKD